VETTATPFIWFDHGAEEAINLYVSLFNDGKITNIQRLPAEDMTVSVIDFELGGTKFVALDANGAPKPHEAFSFSILCENQAEVDRIWDALIAEGEPIQCGWLRDKYGFCWQINPECMHRYMKEGNEAQRKAVMLAMMDMVKMDEPTLTAAYNNASNPID
jgi:predicted 3-demethylubiquinone-9 3-methyltransferase (glyoxalase superfamily)